MKVFCRVAPTTSTNDVRFAVEATTCDDGTKADTLTVGDGVSGACGSICCPVHKKGRNDTQLDVYEAVVAPMVDDVLHGGVCSLLAYGQTSTGKTHTMFGPDGGNVKYFSSVDTRGMVPRLAQEIFYRSPRASVAIKYFELYNETATDMVAKVSLESTGTLTSSLYGEDDVQRHPQVVYRATEKQRLLKSLQSVTVTNGNDCLQVIGELSAFRSIASTEANLKSTRSHVVIQMDVFSRHSSGQITFVDLAGSESLKNHHSDATSSGTLRLSGFDDLAAVQKAAAAQARQHEMKHINTSLFALKKVVHALSQKQIHVPVNESLLTVVLAQSLQRSSCAMIVCCSPLRQDIYETLASLRLGAEASKIPVNTSKVHMQRALAAGSARSVSSSSSSAPQPPLELEREDDPMVPLPVLFPHKITTTSVAPPPITATSVDYHEEMMEKDQQIRMLTIKCRHLANAYDSAMEEIGRLRQALSESTQRKQLELDAHIKRNSLRLSGGVGGVGGGGSGAVDDIRHSDEQLNETSSVLRCDAHDQPARMFGGNLTNTLVTSSWRGELRRV
ncbi:kinesin, putative [Bodo saltans]|uniref:Kinesin-like protein n=1 Tax=Bodo saltans TaxID=75058 RepID=A0A0S4JLC6_BODSA|nr:kinesin, putative [Bodo saltans]|eukprot:CUG89281.1 kinesin, putative [Bodo saltans]